MPFKSKSLEITKKTDKGREEWMVTENGQTKYYTADSLPQEIREEYRRAETSINAKRTFTIETKEGLKEYKSFDDIPEEYRKTLKEKGLTCDEIRAMTRANSARNDLKIIFIILAAFLLLLFFIR